MLFDGCSCDCETTFRVQYRDPSPDGKSVTLPSSVICPCCAKRHDFPAEVVGIECLTLEGQWEAVPLVDFLVTPRDSSSAQSDADSFEAATTGIFDKQSRR